MKHILVIRHSSFGDMIMTMGTFRTIRKFHPQDQITLLTTSPFVEMAERSGYFDYVMVDSRPKLWNFPAWIRLSCRLRQKNFALVYDLQRSQRTGMIFRLMTCGRDTEWSGVVAGCSLHVDDDPNDGQHVLERLKKQLAVAGIAELLPTDISWMRGDVSRFHLPETYVLMVAGSAANRPEKRASANLFASFAQYLISQGIAVLLLGTSIDQEQIEAITATCPMAVNLCNQTNFSDIAEIARGSVGAICNDTGTTHLIAATNCPTLVLFSGNSDPRLILPQGDCVEVIRRDNLDTLQLDEVIPVWNKFEQRHCGRRENLPCPPFSKGGGFAVTELSSL